MVQTKSPHLLTSSPQVREEAVQQYISKHLLFQITLLNTIKPSRSLFNIYSKDDVEDILFNYFNEAPSFSKRKPHPLTPSPQTEREQYSCTYPNIISTKFFYEYN